MKRKILHIPNQLKLKFTVNFFGTLNEKINLILSLLKILQK